MTGTKQTSYQVVTPHCRLLGEGPVWDASSGTICLALCTNGDFAAALKSGLPLINRQTGRIRSLHHPEAHLPGNRLNDGKVDPAGRFWIGSMPLSEATSAGNLYMIEKDLSHSVKIEGVTISNGMA